MRFAGLKTRIETSVFQESLVFYTEHLGMAVLESWNKTGDTGAILGLESSAQNEAYLELAEVESPSAFSGISLQFRVHDVAAIAEKFRGILQYRGPVERPWGSTYLYLEDPAGIQVILYEGKL